MRVESTKQNKQLDQDHYEGFSVFEKVLFQRFANSVAREVSLLDGTKDAPKSYRELMDRINFMVHSQPSIELVHESSRNMLVKLFPRWLLDQFKIMFAKPLPHFSNWMNAWVTHFTTTWLMGPSKVQVEKKTNAFVVVVEKCRFLEESGPCLKTCINACKVPTQDFFQKDMGIMINISPNVTDYSCRFEFGVQPKQLSDDPLSLSPCFSDCVKKKGQRDFNTPCLF
jgi:hypothetical protein